jgi:hypothetical protein
MRLTRRKLLLAGGAGAVLAAGGVYELVDQLTGAPSRAAAGAGGLPPEQHVLRGVRLVEDNGVEVVVPPLHHQLVTARVAVADRKSDLAGAQGALESVLAKLDQRYEQTPAGLGVTVGPGTAIPHRADFNTLDNPFFWSSHPERDAMDDKPAAGVHFVIFNPSSDDFDRGRLAMDGHLPDGTKLPFQPRDRGQGFNSILRTTHRQNFLVPPRRHRSFPLVELLA